LEEARSRLNALHVQEEVYWRQKERIKWLAEGCETNNIKSFHSSVLAETILHLQAKGDLWVLDI